MQKFFLLCLVFEKSQHSFAEAVKVTPGYVPTTTALHTQPHVNISDQKEQMPSGVQRVLRNKNNSEKGFQPSATQNLRTEKCHSRHSCEL